MDQSKKTKMLDISQIKLNPNNPRTIKDDKFKKLCKSIKENPEFLDARPIVVKDNMVIGGNMRYRALLENKMEIKPEWIKDVTGWTDEAIRKFIVIDNIAYGDNDWDMLANEYEKEELENWGMDVDRWIEDDANQDEANKKLVNKFIIPPFSVFDTRQGYWQDRKKTWLALGIESEIGRDAEAYELMGLRDKKYGIGDTLSNGTSIFDPVLCEISYRWFNVGGGSILDPFAGGSVRGIVAEKLGYKYTGIELSDKQITANRENSKTLKVEPNWMVGDSNVKLDRISEQYDMVFSCPPYMDLEVYSDDPADISNMKPDEFDEVYRSIIKKSVSKLKDNRFAVFVVSEVRGKTGNFNGLVPTTIKAFEDAGMVYYNEIILVNTAGTLPIRVSKQFNSGRKIGRMHQNILVFYKGNTREITKNFEKLDFSDLPSEGGENDG